MNYSHPVDPQTCVLSVYHGLLIGLYYKSFLLMEIPDMLEMHLVIEISPTSVGILLQPPVGNLY